MAKWNIGAFLRSLTKGAETETPPPAEQAEASQNILTEEMGPVAAESTAVRYELKGALLDPVGLSAIQLSAWPSLR